MKIGSLMKAILSAAFGQSTVADAGDVSPPPTPLDITYEALVEKAESGDDDLDFTALRLAYVRSKLYAPGALPTGKIMQEAQTALQKADFGTALAKADEVLKIDYTNSLAHSIRGTCFHGAGLKDRGTRELAIAHSLVASVLKSGNGAAPETAFHVVTLLEEYRILALFSLGVLGQRLIQKDGHSYDCMQCRKMGTGEHNSVYFRVDDILAGRKLTFTRPATKALS
jgi:hypothetical protein